MPDSSTERRGHYPALWATASEHLAVRPANEPAQLRESFSCAETDVLEFSIG